MGRNGKNYTEEFKKQIVALRSNGKSAGDIAKEYKIARSTVNKWVTDYNNTKSFKAKDNRSQTENDILKLKKELKRLEMENDILKQAALIMARK